ncbi:RloB family protein [Streptomyces sp. NBC_01549]|uniref:RloB family protein n=1 Tax=Streptomyces sp. NBC_01549 TaxID=2975874 RepID=UPI00225229D3|nr:RloB family protein [Streptomyces sp. NBC_01549]MCX4589085.1 RloB family protein [Streptomyces sp. NBC_01549]
MSEWGGQQHQGSRKRKRRSNKDEEQPLEPPRLPEPSESKAQRVLYVACEGESTEPDYLNYLNKRFGDGSYGVPQRFMIHPVKKGNGYTPSRAVAAVRDKAVEGCETWALFDRDDHHDIPQALKEAAEDSTEVCYSHPSFDLWLLLHFQQLSGRQGKSSDNVHEKLRKAHPAFRRFDKPGGGKGLDESRRRALEGKVGAAIGHAKGLVTQCEHGSCKANQRVTKPVDRDDPGNPDYLPQSTRKWAARSGHALDCEVLKRDPSTDVWRLLESLGITADAD